MAMDRIIITTELPERTGRRGYLKLKDIAKHKSFILDMHNAGKKQRDIINALKEQKGVVLELHRLKRILNKWKASHKSLTKRRKLCLRNKIEKRQNENKYSHKVTFKRSGRVLTQEEIKDTMAISPSYFEGVKPSPGDMVICTPAPDTKQANKNPEANTIEQYLDLEDLNPSSQNLDIDNNTENIVVRDTCSIGDGAELPVEFDDSDEQSSIIAEEDDRSWSDLDEERVYPFPAGSNLEELCSLGLNDQNSMVDFGDEDIADTISLNSHLGSTENLGSEETETEIQAPDKPRDNAPETPIQSYTRAHEKDFQNYVTTWQAIAEEYLDLYKELSMRFDIPLENVADRFSDYILDFFGYHDVLPYHICLQILEDHPPILLNQTHITSSIDENMLCEFFESKAEMVVEVLSVSPRPDSPQVWQIINENLVHIPRLIEDYGLYHFFTVRGQGNCYILLKYLDILSDSEVCDLRFYVLDCLNVLGLSSLHISLRILGTTSYPDPERAKADLLEDDIRRNILKRHGKSDVRTIFAYSCLARTLAFRGDRRSETMAYGIIDTIKNLPATVSQHHKMWVVTSLENLGMALVSVRKYNLVVKILEQARFWHNHELSGGMRIPIPQANQYLGIAYDELGEYKKSLGAFYRLFYDNKEKFPFDDWRVVDSISWITEVMEKRGPIIYTSVDPIFDSIFRVYEKAGKTNHWAFRKLWAVWENSGIDVEKLRDEYKQILSLEVARRTTREKTPDLQEFFYFQGLESWVYSQKIRKEDGRVEVCDDELAG
ncbi:hypothetical protein H072_474 [Dactylellina haptotyla CBS 200.50]|uniref:Clr5 domain-containing protein n=1 Tax=Dactylellina haptotyla (strain CBS 200.50) TaxID=1284197 RepID=S8ARE7_DACHA|nr:hypothetical protein H072_474 [Dactylellina haptotyla CBS 200.50]